MKKIFSIFIVFTLIFSCVGCADKSQSMQPEEKPDDSYSATQGMASSVEETDTEENVVEEHFVINPLKQGIDLNNVEDAIISIDFNISDFDIENRTLTASFYERDIYDAVEISNMKVGDSIIISDTVFPVDKITKNDEFIDINDGYTYSEFGMTFMPYEGGTYRTLLLDDYSTYSKIGDKVFTISEDFVLTDYEGGEPDNDGVKSNLVDLNNYFNNLSEWSSDFSYTNTVAHIVNNEIVSIVRYWVP